MLTLSQSWLPGGTKGGVDEHSILALTEDGQPNVKDLTVSGHYASSITILVPLHIHNSGEPVSYDYRIAACAVCGS